MSEQQTRDLRPFLQARASRRQVMGGIGAGAAGLALAGAALSVAGQSSTPIIAPAGSPAASPGASPAASPIASPEATPLPDPVPETSLTIVRDQRPQEPGDPQRGGELRLFVRAADLHDFSPTALRQDFQIPLTYLDPLIWINEVSMQPQNWLARAWSWSDDGLTLRIALREDVTWHDGTPLTTEDVRFSFEAYRDDYDSAMANFFGLVNRIEVKHETRIDIVFDEPDGAFVFNAANLPIFQSAQYKTRWEQRPVGQRTLTGFNWDESPPIGTGPWKFAGKRDTYLVFTRNDDYWHEPPHFDRLVLTAEDDQQKRLEAWRNGDADIVWPVRATEMGDLWKQEGQLFIAEAPVAFFAAFNFDNPANATADMMRDPALRQALTLAVDRQGYARDLFYGFINEQAAGTITQPWAHDDALTNPAFDIDRANQILDEAGWQDTNGDGMREDANGNTLDLYCIVQDTERPELLAVLDRLGENFGRIGARLTVQRIEPGSFDTRWSQNRQYDMVAYSITQYAAFAEYDLYGSAWDIRSNRAGWNPGAYSNADVDAAINEYFGAWSIEDMTAALHKLQRAANDDLFGLWFGFPRDLVLVRPDIRGYAPNKMFQTWGTRQLWRGERQEAPAQPSPVASPVVTEEASPMASPVS
ncbi:MAG TPA: ABC transporter substrate-binding protein [Thermomicrobiales bacterium]|nr:ABC transporter substrate-binding protein [Thermomicrobiales bacterium]